MPSMANADESMPRAKRLKLLREAKARKERGEAGDKETSDLAAAAINPATDELMKVEAGEPHDQQDTAMTGDKTQDVAEEVSKVQEEDAKIEYESEEELLNLAPKRANWDMERDIAPMLRKLERRTQHAIVEILREKLAVQQQEEDSDNDEADDEEEEVEDTNA